VAVLITGHLGQDGSFLRENLARQGEEVIGLGRDSVDFFDAHGVKVREKTRPKNLSVLVEAHEIEAVYHLASDNSSSEVVRRGRPSSASPFAGNVGELAEYEMLLAGVERFNRECKVFYAGSSHVFSPGPVRDITEKTPFSPVSTYGWVKAAGIGLSRKYRKERGLFVSSGILFNHESVKRSSSFLTARVINEAISVSRGTGYIVTVGNLEARVDWGHAEDFVRAFETIMNHPTPEDFIVATGYTHSVKEFVEIVFDELGLDFRRHIVTDGSMVRADRNIEKANPSRLFDLTSWRPSQDFDRFVRRLVSEHLARGTIR
jgi:GDPmannose 4,6-dehydratase